MSTPTGPLPTSTPNPTLYDAVKDVSTPEELHRYLVEVSDCLSTNSDLGARKESMCDLLQALADDLLLSFPSPYVVPHVTWSHLKDSLMITSVYVKIIHQLSSTFQESKIFVGPRNIAQSIIIRFFHLCNTLELWSDFIVLKEDGQETPVEFRSRIIDVCPSILRIPDIGTRTNVESENAGWERLRKMGIECLSLCEELLMLSPNESFPFYLTPLQTPHIQANASMEDLRTIEIRSFSQIPAMIVMALEIMIKSLAPPLASQWLLDDIARRVMFLIQRTFDYLLSPLCAVTSTKRASVITRLLAAVARIVSFPEDFKSVWDRMRHRFVMRRLQDGPDSAWEQADVALKDVIKSPMSTRPHDVHIPSVIGIIHECNIDVQAPHLRDLGTAYLCSLVPHLHDVELDCIVQTLGDGSEATLNLLIAAKAQMEARKPQPGTQERQRIQPEDIGWRSHIKSIVQALVEPDQVEWMEDDESSTDTQYISRALNEIEERFKKPIHNTTRIGREGLARELVKLPCALFHSPSYSCDHPQRKPAIAIIPICLRVGACLLDGNESEVTASVRKQIYIALGRGISHHTSGFGGGRLVHASEFISRGLKDQDRSVRLAAGKSLAELVKCYQAIGSGTADLEHLLDPLTRLCAGVDNRMKETAIITGGYIAKISAPDVLFHVLCFLVVQLGDSNAAIRGTAFLQLQGIAKHRRTGEYTLLAPYLNRIAPQLVLSASLQPLTLAETCRFLSVSSSQFISITQSTVLPLLFARRDLRTLQIVSSSLGIGLASLFMKHSAGILAYIFCQPTGHTDMTNFVLSILEVPGVDSIDLASIVRSCLVNLLAEIITTMGDNLEGPTDTTIRAIIRVEAAANTNPRGSAERDVGAILRPKMLGVITSLHDLLQDLHGRKSIETKRGILRSLGHFVTLVGPAVSHVAPQLMATMQSMLPVPEFAETTLQSWQTFLQVLDPKDLGPLLAATSASFVTHWPTFSHHAREIAKKCLEYLIIEKGESLKPHLGEVADLGSIPHLAEVNARLHEQRPRTNPAENVEELLERASNDNVTVAARALGELKEFMLSDASNMNGMTSGDIFDPLVGRLLSVLMAAACRVGENVESLNMLAYDCIGILGAIDPDRIDFGAPETRLIMLSNFTDEEESVSFALHLVTNILVGAFKATSDIMYQRHVAYTIQELLRFCKFNGSLVSPNGGSVPLRVRTRWANLPKHVQEAISPLLELRYHSQISFNDDIVSPIYPNQATYREWIQCWTVSLTSRVNTQSAKDIFRPFMVLVRNKDAGVAHYLLPHLALTVLVSGTNDDAANIRNEILSVLEDQVDPDSPSTHDKKELSSQVIFMLMDHLNEWVRLTRQHLNTAIRAESRRARSARGGEAEEQLVKVDSILSSIDQSLMAKAALKCKAYARALMCYEQQIVALRSHNNTTEVQDHYERLHEIYSQLDEPDGMEGVSTLILSPSLDHQIRQHESTGRWTSAQSCWEVRLQNSPDELVSHLGLLECLRNLGHYDTMRTHAKGVLTRNPGWQAELVRYQVESEWNIGNWDEVQSLVKLSNKPSASVLIAQILLAMRSEDQGSFSTAVLEARRALGGPITAAGTRGYRRCYESVVNLHLVHELEMIYHLTRNRSTGKELDSLLRRLSSRLDSTLPAYRIREPILSLCRTAFGHWAANIQSYKDVISRSWLNSAKLARKAGYWQTAYSATLQAQQRKQPFVFMESSKLTKAIGEPLKALQELETSMELSDTQDHDIIDLTGDEDGSKRMKAKAKALRARWMNDSDRFDVSQVLKAFQEATELWPDWESGQFHLGRFHDDCFKSLSPSDQVNRGTKMNLQTVKSFSKAIRYGSKYIYQTVPRLLTLWLDMGEHPTTSKSETFTRINLEVSRAIKNTPVYKWYTAFPQIVSRVGHTNKDVFAVLSKLISGVIHEFPKQALWLFASVVKSTKHTRRDRGKHILDKIQSHPSSRTEVAALITACRSMIDELLNLCNHPVRDDKTTMLMMSKDFPRLFRQVPSTLIIPLQESLTASLPPTSASEGTHQPFPVDTPTFAKFHEEIDIMKSLAKPRKITITGSDNKVYMFLGKPKDDLRKDARLMDFNAIINKLLKSNSESRRRHLYIRTYGVVTLNEECGFIQWVPNTIPLRPVLLKYYSARGVRQWDGTMGQTFGRIKELPDKEAAALFKKDILSGFPVIFHEWFLETFPEPSAWLASRLSFSRTAAVMSMVGFILGLGDRHTENILLDVLSGDAVHVDFNCLFEKGKTLETPERVPFRLTQNMVDGLGITGVEGVFRNACEITMQLLRDNKDTLMSVLDAFVHDPLVEWEDEKRKLEREAQRRSGVKDLGDLRLLAKNSLQPIDKKLRGIYSMGKEKSEKEISTSSLVQILIQEATDEANLAKMYPGWAPWL